VGGSLIEIKDLDREECYSLLILVFFLKLVL
jgi:hypothetical protein